jgi:hypothetical protein
MAASHWCICGLPTSIPGANKRDLQVCIHGICHWRMVSTMSFTYVFCACKLRRAEAGPIVRYDFQVAVKFFITIIGSLTAFDGITAFLCKSLPVNHVGLVAQNSRTSLTEQHNSVSNCICYGWNRVATSISQFVQLTKPCMFNFDFNWTLANKIEGKIGH